MFSYVGKDSERQVSRHKKGMFGISSKVWESQPLKEEYSTQCLQLVRDCQLLPYTLDSATEICFYTLIRNAVAFDSY